MRPGECLLYKSVSDDERGQVRKRNWKDGKEGTERKVNRWAVSTRKRGSTRKGHEGKSHIPPTPRCLPPDIFPHAQRWAAEDAELDALRARYCATSESW